MHAISIQKRTRWVDEKAQKEEIEGAVYREAIKVSDYGSACVV